MGIRGQQFRRQDRRLDARRFPFPGEGHHVVQVQAFRRDGGAPFRFGGGVFAGDAAKDNDVRG